ncbi:vesicle coat protein [Podospora fimiseda]|uniref:Vesicle coat protein n=1 Tax=Podospora fimiseda TaxID=252190 RepID=A0AAN7BQG8_9PEZI|nr:vesicle coat protein [Podospora fimiseda]
MTSILCLAHYCDLHGPTPLMVTEGLPVPCNVCYDSDTTSADSQTATAITEAFRRMNVAGQQSKSFEPQQRSTSLPASELEAQAAQRASLRKAAAQGATSGSAIETPPQSPRLPGNGGGATLQQQKAARADSAFKRTYDDYVTRNAGPCNSCALTLPKLQSGSKDNGGVGERGPTLRTKAPCARVYSGGIDTSSPPISQSSSSSPSEDESSNNGRQHHRPSHRRTATAVSVTSRSSENSSSTATNLNAHTHYLEYISTHEPLAPSSFSIVRASCLRTLSLETLPRTQGSAPTNSINSPSSTPCASPSTPAFVTTHSVGNAASGGPIFFGDSAAGYTTAYIFRIPDLHARGHKRVYAFLALSTHRERLAMKTFGFVAAAFRDLASWIQGMAEAEAERTLAAESGSAGSSPILPEPGYGSFGPTIQERPPQPVGGTVGSGSSFLAMGGMGGLARRMGGGFGPSAVSLKQRGLAELVGRPDFFIELHTKFVRLLVELGVAIGS